MRRTRLLAMLVAISATCALAANPTPIEIPLKEIHALGMPGTRDVRKLRSARADDQIVESIRLALVSAPDREQSPKGFVVLGTGDDALRSARDILAEEKRRSLRFAAGSELSAVFFSYQSGMYVHLAKVERQGNSIKIAYQLVPHESAETTEHFALIPLGVLPEGKYTVSINRTPQSSYPQQGVIQPSESTVARTVCSSFEFVVGN
jgi:hypothetical protein